MMRKKKKKLTLDILVHKQLLKLQASLFGKSNECVNQPMTKMQFVLDVSERKKNVFISYTLHI